MVPSLILHTTGRSTGLRRSVVLVYATDADKFLVVASNFGKDRPPAWLLNLKVTSHAEVNVGPSYTKVEAEVVDPADPRYPELFRRVNENNRRRYDRYAALTDRPIPIVVLSPRRRTVRSREDGDMQVENRTEARIRTRPDPSTAPSRNRRAHPARAFSNLEIVSPQGGRVRCRSKSRSWGVRSAQWSRAST
jgi:F420H(2)-dependent quinone reductase